MRTNTSRTDDSHSLIPSEIEQSILEVFESLVIATEQKVANAALEICDGEILVEPNRFTEMLDCDLMLAERGIDQTNVGENLR